MRKRNDIMIRDDMIELHDQFINVLTRIVISGTCKNISCYLCPFSIFNSKSETRCRACCLKNTYRARLLLEEYLEKESIRERPVDYSFKLYPEAVDNVLEFIYFDTKSKRRSIGKIKNEKFSIASNKKEAKNYLEWLFNGGQVDRNIRTMYNEHEYYCKGWGFTLCVNYPSIEITFSNGKTIFHNSILSLMSLTFFNSANYAKIQKDEEGKYILNSIFKPIEDNVVKKRDDVYISTLFNMYKQREEEYVKIYKEN